MRLFDSFANMIEDLPVKAILRAADAERRMVEDDLARQRISPNEDTDSVLAFCQFLEAAERGAHFPLPALPMEHCAFYRKIVQKLVDVGELHHNVQGWVDDTFSRALTEALLSPV